MENQFNSKDQEQWDRIFQTPNPAWKKAPPQAFMKDALEFFRSGQSKCVLDIGCGVGIWSIYLARNGLEVYGTDFSENAVNFCKEWAHEENLKAKFETAPITSDAFPLKQFDAVVASLILDNVIKEEMDHALSLVRGKLKQKGTLFAFFNPHFTDEEKEQVLKTSDNPTKDITSVNYSDEELRAAFKGFNLVEFKKYPIQGMEFRGLLLQKS